MLNFYFTVAINRLDKKNNLNYLTMKKAKIPHKIIKDVLLQQTVMEINNEIL